MHRWCNGSTRVSKAFCPGSNPGLCVLRCALIREAYILVTRLNSEVGSTPTASANLEAEKQLLKLARCRNLKVWCRRQIGKAVDLSSRCLRVQLPSALPNLLKHEQQKQIIGRLAYQRGQRSVKPPLLALQVRLLPDLPIMESKSIGRAALFAKQMDEQLWFESTALRL
jgi:hypothetical protein